MLKIICRLLFQFIQRPTSRSVSCVIGAEYTVPVVEASVVENDADVAAIPRPMPTLALGLNTHGPNDYSVHRVTRPSRHVRRIYG